MKIKEKEFRFFLSVYLSEIFLTKKFKIWVLNVSVKSLCIMTIFFLVSSVDMCLLEYYFEMLNI